MAEVLLQNLEYIRQTMKKLRKKHLKEMTTLILGKRYIGEKLVLMAPEKWGKGWMPAPFNRMVNRFAIFIFLLYKGKFQMAKEILKNTNMMYLGFSRQSIKFEEYTDRIMYEIIYVLTKWAEETVATHKKKAKRKRGEIFKIINYYLRSKNK